MTRLLLTLTVLALCLSGGIVFAVETTLTAVPDKAFYRPGEAVTITVHAPGAATIEATVTYLLETAAALSAPVVDGKADLTWTPPTSAPRGYGVELRALDADGNMLASASTAFDVLERWTQAPRYGFLSAFEPGRNNAAETMDWAARFHVNGLQFYDWQYRHETLLPPEAIYSDLLGKQMSMDVIHQLIEAAHSHNIAAMPYTAIYGASATFYRQHPDWALFQRPGDPYLFGDDFLVIMDAAPGSPWNTHLLGEFGRVLDETAFDGIHIDQYGAPKVGLNSAGETVKLDEVFPAFINQTAELVDEKRGEAGAVIFNAVGNWPVETVAPSQQDAVYIEVWSPYRKWMDLPRIIKKAEELGGGKPVIIAAYIHPERAANARLANALIFASGAYHLELGEPGAMLADPYFPKFGMMDAALEGVMGRYYDFLVRYENVLSLDTTGLPEDRTNALTIEGVQTEGQRSRDRVAVIGRQGQNVETFSLVNLMGIDGLNWDEALRQAPTPLTDLNVRINTSRPVARIWWASPDGENPQPQSVDFTADETGITFTLPGLAYWSMVVVEYR